MNQLRLYQTLVVVLALLFAGTSAALCVAAKMYEREHEHATFLYGCEDSQRPWVCENVWQNGHPE